MAAVPESLEVALARAVGATDRRETHTSWVFLTATRAYKLKKPVRFGFVDMASRAVRHRLCEEEARVNRELAPDVVLGVRGVLPDGRLTASDDPAAADWVVEMRRFDEQRTMATLAARGTLTSADAAAVGRRIADFHAAARRVECPRLSSHLARQWNDNLAELATVGGSEHTDAVEALRVFARGFIRRRGAELDARGAAGLVRDGHGDLRADHVLLDGAVTIVDRLEFDASLREIDVADDLAFLAMDLEARGVRWAAEAVVDAYRAAGGDAGDDGLLAFFGAYRAAVRAKVELLRAGQPGADVDRWRDRAAGLLRLAEHLAWRSRGPVLVVICGPPASGKSSLASELAARLREPVLSSDAVRKELLGIERDERAPLTAYSASSRGRVYDELARRVAARPAGGGAIVDATCGERAARSRFLASLDDIRGRSVRWIECRAPVATLMHRAAARSPRRGHGSDAGPAVAARAARAFEPLAELPDDRRCVVETTEPVPATLRRLGTWLDGALAKDRADAAAR